MEQDIRERAAQTVVDSFKVVERIYRHAHQTMTSLKEEIKTANNLRFESDVISCVQSSSDPASWIYRFRGLYLAHQNFSFEEYKQNTFPVFFLQSSIFNPDAKEPIIRFGIIKKIFNFNIYKNARFKDFVREILTELHAEREARNIRAPHCEAKVMVDEKLLLDLREDSNIEALTREISEKYGYQCDFERYLEN